MFFRSILVYMTVILVASIVGCGEKEAESPVTPTGDSNEGMPLVSPAVVEFAKAPWDVNGDGQIDILDLVLVGQHIGETVKAPEEEGAVEGHIGDTLDNGYYRVTVKGIVESPPTYSSSWGSSWILDEFEMEIENVGNEQPTYVGNFNFWVVDDNNNVYPQRSGLGGGLGILLGVGQKLPQNYVKDEDWHLDFYIYSAELARAKLIFQAYKEIFPIALGDSVLFFPVGEPIGRPIVFNIGPTVSYVEPQRRILDSYNGKWKENTISNNDIIWVIFNETVDPASLAGITITGGSVSVTDIFDIMALIELKNVAEGKQILDVSAVTDIEGNPIILPEETEFITYEVRNIPPMIVSSTPRNGESNVNPEIDRLIIELREDIDINLTWVEIMFLSGGSLGRLQYDDEEEAWMLDNPIRLKPATRYIVRASSTDKPGPGLGNFMSGAIVFKTK